jgi:galactokinase
LDGQVSTVTAVAPGRVNLVGEHTDYNGGLCLPFAIPLATTARVTPRADRRLRVSSDQGASWQGTLDQVADHDVTGWASYVAGVLWALIEAGWEVPGVDIELTTTIPLGGGLSSSAALECSVAVAMAELLGRDVGPGGRLVLAELCRRAETEYVGAPTGGMDQLACLLATAGHGVLIDFADAAAPATSSVPLDPAGAGLTLLVTDTGVRHALADGDGGYAQRRAECQALATDPATSDPVLRARGRHVESENDRVRSTVTALTAGAWEDVGRLLTASHVSLRDDYEVSCPELDLTVDAATVAGALGARMTGGGFGGSVIALVHEGRVDVVRNDIDAAFVAAGLPRPTPHVVTPAAGARSVRQVT